MKSSSQALSTEVQFATLNKGNYFNFINRYKSICCYSGVSDIITTKEAQLNLVSTSGGHHENWGESTVAEASPRTDTSTDDKNQRHERGQLAAVVASDSSDKSKEKSGDQKEPLTEQQLVGIYSLQQSFQQAEDALSQGMEALQQPLAETLAKGSPGSSGSSGNVANYIGQMAMAIGKLGTLEGFLRQCAEDG
uniref:Uncharacterized protein n=1 Tax=Quercus lobata TaxID=97700 RepID=A0A7N2M380_QUELO